MTLQLVAQQLMQSLTQQLQVYFIVLDITFLCHRITFSLNIFDNVLNREII